MSNDTDWAAWSKEAMVRILIPIFLLCLVSCKGSESSRSASKPAKSKQKITSLSKADEARLNKQRRLVRKHLGMSKDNQTKFATVAGKLGTIRAILKAGTFKPSETNEVQSLGVVFGDALAQHLGLKWVMVEDKFGRDPGLSVPGTSIQVYPLTMISKRVERGEKVDIFHLFNATLETVAKLKKSQKYKK